MRCQPAVTGRGRGACGQPNRRPRPLTRCDYATHFGRTPVTGRYDREFTQFVVARLGVMRRIAYLLCQDLQRADDLVQAGITRLYIYWDRARQMDHIEAYGRTILVRQYLSERRSAWARRVVLDGRGRLRPRP